MRGMFASQISKRTGIYSFTLGKLESEGPLPFLGAADLNGIRRGLATSLDLQPCRSIPLYRTLASGQEQCPAELSYKANVANAKAREIYMAHGARTVEDAFELSHRKEVELMRSKYCIRFELGLCPVHQHAAPSGDLFLLNNGKRYALEFDCRNCEMVVREA